MVVFHYSDVIMYTMASQITSATIVYSTIYSSVDQRKHQSSASLAFVREIHGSPVNSPHKGPVTRKMLPFDDVIMYLLLFSADPCASLTCQNGGTCSASGSTASCSCPEGFYGNDCSSDTPVGEFHWLNSACIFITRLYFVILGYAMKSTNSSDT